MKTKLEDFKAKAQRTKIMRSFSETLFELLGALLYIVVPILINGLSIMLVWNWFLPSASIAPAISFYGALGMSFVIGVFRKVPNYKDLSKSFEGQATNPWMDLLTYLAVRGLFLLTAWTVYVILY